MAKLVDALLSGGSARNVPEMACQFDSDPAHIKGMNADVTRFILFLF